MEKKITIEKNGMKITLEGYSIQELNRILTDEPIREINLKDLVNQQKQEPIRITPLTIQDDFRHLVNTEEQKRVFKSNPLSVEYPVSPAYIITSIL